jgi:quinoprotein glucose dehydrogenase
VGSIDNGNDLIELLRRNDNQDAYVRHAASYALARLEAHEALAAAEQDESAAVRLGVILAYRELGEARVANFLDDADAYLVREAALAINDAPINAAMPALAAMLGSGDLEDIPLQHRIINARHRLGRPEDAVALAAYASRKEVPVALREEALAQLATWPAPFHRDRLVGVYRPLPDRDAAPAIAAVEEQLPLLLEKTPRRVRRAVLSAIKDLKINAAAPTMHALVANAEEDGEIRAEALGVLNDLDDKQLMKAVQVAGASDSPNLRMATLPILARLSPKQALPILSRMASDGTPEEQQAAYDAIANLADPAAAELLVSGLKRLQAGEVPYLAQVELLDAAEASSAPAVQEAYTALQAHWAESGDTLAPYRSALEGGDGRRGWRLFNQHPVLACTRCHKAFGEGGEAGPDLSDLAERATAEYMLEAIVDPNATIAPGFDVVAFTMKDGGYHVGTIAEETDQKIVIWDAAGEKQELDPAQVADRAAAPSSMPAIFGMVLKRSELRDLMAFMKALRPRDLAGEGEGESAPRATHGE